MANLKILIVYASAGTGHRRAAEAIYNYLRNSRDDLQVKIIDVLDYTNLLFKRLYSRGYSYLISRSPFLWKMLYNFTCNTRLSTINSFLQYAANRLNTGKFKKLLSQDEPDVIFSTHFLPCQVACLLKKNKLIDSKIVCVITDFNVHPIWVIDNLDHYTVGSEFALTQLESYGVSRRKVRFFGIPVDLKFIRGVDKLSTYKNLDLKKNQFTVLISTSAFGLKVIEQIVELLYRDIQLLVVCGNNRQLYNKLQNKSYSSVKVFGFIDNIEQLMGVSDLAIIKPGGLSCSECLAMCIPMIFISAIYGQESKNAEILQDHGVGITAANLNDLRNKVIYYKENPQELNLLRERIKKIRQPFAAKEISECFLPK